MWCDAPRRKGTSMSEKHFEIGYFDPAEGIDQTQRYLPHWFQPNVAMFVTFRTADSLPKEVVRRWHDEQRAWLCEHGWPIEAEMRRFLIGKTCRSHFSGVSQA